MNTNLLFQPTEIENLIHVIRNQQVMIDRDLAELYGVKTKRLNEQVKRNIERFPSDFCFQLNEQEFENWKSQFATSNSDKMGVRRAPYAFTEQGVAMLASILKSEIAIAASVKIMRAFVAMRRFMMNNARVFTELDAIKKHLMESDHHQMENDKKIEYLLNIMDRYRIDEKQGVFFQGQIFDAYAKFESFIQSAKHDIILIDQYVDLSVLERFAKKQNGVLVTIYTHPQTPLTQQDLQRFNAQYPTLTIQHSTTIHDRFLIIDHTLLYHIGASLKDLGKKCFAFEIMEDSIRLIPKLLSNT
ncbi:MAG: ORF6N domain-containing protein [Bacteroidales bacterium]|nr:ORF6N domain-containing protein [Bacteroidales bacterium]